MVGRFEPVEMRFLYPCPTPELSLLGASLRHLLYCMSISVIQAGKYIVLYIVEWGAKQ